MPFIINSSQWRILSLTSSIVWLTICICRDSRTDMIQWYMNVRQMSTVCINRILNRQYMMSCYIIFVSDFRDFIQPRQLLSESRVRKTMQLNLDCTCSWDNEMCPSFNAPKCMHIHVRWIIALTFPLQSKSGYWENDLECIHRVASNALWKKVSLHCKRSTW